VRKWILTLIIFTTIVTQAQDTLTTSISPEPPNPYSFNKVQSPSASRKWLLGTGMALAYGGSFVFLNEAWYKGYPRTSFHSFNDAGEWLQMDKIGHGWTAYHTSRLNTALWKWAGLSQQKSVLTGTAIGLGYMLSIEYLDGRSAEWGWSWPDVAADIFGASLFASQALTWKEQRINLKFSSYQKNYQPGALTTRAQDLFGKSPAERLLKDYNAQTYWLSGNMKTLFNIPALPPWLNISVGYGADGMFGGYDNIARDKQGNISFNRPDIQRYRQWYLSPDVDLTRIKTRSRLLRSAFFLLNSFKFPAPALELSRGKLQAHWLAF
jgi:uncharacterized protein YfiM (DUF2279 family)